MRVQTATVRQQQFKQQRLDNNYSNNNGWIATVGQQLFKQQQLDSNRWTITVQS